MKIEKNKIVFGSVLAVVIIFIISYTFLIMGNDDEENKNLKQTLVPELIQEQDDYNSKLDAINDLKEVRKMNAPSIYNEAFIDSLGFYDPDLTEKEKKRLVDSIYKYNRIDYSENEYRDFKPKITNDTKIKNIDNSLEKDLKIETQEIGLNHQLFFASNPQMNPYYNQKNTDSVIHVMVDGNQIVKQNYRLRMRLTKAALVNNRIVRKNTPIYGFISFQPNRAMIDIENIMHQSIKLKAFDLQDGSEGIYIENSFRADAKHEVVEDFVDDINVAGVPQVSGIKKVFQRSNQNVKITVVNNYKMILKVSQKK